jgi:hypothetical protein
VREYVNAHREQMRLLARELLVWRQTEGVRLGKDFAMTCGLVDFADELVAVPAAGRVLVLGCTIQVFGGEYDLALAQGHCRAHYQLWAMCEKPVQGDVCTDHA